MVVDGEIDAAEVDRALLATRVRDHEVKERVSSNVRWSQRVNSLERWLHATTMKG